MPVPDRPNATVHRNEPLAPPPDNRLRLKSCSAPPDWSDEPVGETERSLTFRLVRIILRLWLRKSRVRTPSSTPNIRLQTTGQDYGLRAVGVCPATIAAVQPPMPLSPGSHLGPYEVLALIGAGGMGEVYRARDPRLNREVAIKVCRRTDSRTKDDDSVSSRSARRSHADSPAHRDGLRSRISRWRRFPGHGIRPRQEPRRAHPPWRVTTWRDAADCHRHRRRPGGRTCPRHHSSGFEARERCRGHGWHVSRCSTSGWPSCSTRTTSRRTPPPPRIGRAPDRSRAAAWAHSPTCA